VQRQSTHNETVRPILSLTLEMQPSAATILVEDFKPDDKGNQKNNAKRKQKQNREVSNMPAKKLSRTPSPMHDGARHRIIQHCNFLRFSRLMPHVYAHDSSRGMSLFKRNVAQGGRRRDVQDECFRQPKHRSEQIH